MSALLLIGFLFAAEQRPALVPEPDRPCTIADPTPLLKKETYEKRGYELKTLSKKPLTLGEKVALDGALDLEIEQRGCEDIVIDFKFRSRSIGADELPTVAIKAIGDLSVSEKALRSSKELRQLREKLEERLKKVKTPSKLDGEVVCLMKIPHECITDVSIRKFDGGIHFKYIDRP